jgi:hypothetical protein
MLHAVVCYFCAWQDLLTAATAVHAIDASCCRQVDPQFFAFRWITLLLTQEFPFPDAVRIWDTLLSDPGGRLDCLLRVCVALLRHVREQLLAGQ